MTAGDTENIVRVKLPKGDPHDRYLSKDLKVATEKEIPDPLAWLKGFELTKADVEQIENQQYVVPGFIPEGHITAIVGRAGVGKTSIVFWLALTEMGKRDYKVIYVHADTHPVEAKEFKARADQAGVRYLTPDMMVGKSMRDVLANFQRMAAAGERLDKVVIIFDTVKKLTTMIQKQAMSQLMATLRLIVARGASVVLLGHVNKHKGADGKDVYEGTGDLENDADNLIYLVGSKADGDLLVSSVCKPGDGQGKMRANIEKLSWKIDAERQVFRMDEYQDTQAMRVKAAQREKDESYIESITEAIKAGNHKQVDITTYCKERHKHGDKRVRDTLKRWIGQEWTCDQNTYSNNAKWYELIGKPAPRRTDQSNQTDSDAPRFD